MASKKGSQAKIFISHHPKTRKESVRRLADYLKDQRYTVWVDTSEMTSSMYEEIAKEGLESADAIIICVCNNYKTGSNNQKEAEFAHHHQDSKLILPLKMQADTDTSGWLGFVIGNHRMIDYTLDSNLDRVIMEIEQQIQQFLSSK